MVGASCLQGPNLHAGVSLGAMCDTPNVYEASRKVGFI